MAARIAENILAAPMVVEVPPVPGTRVYLSGRIPRAVCTAISTFPSEVPRMAHAILTSVPGYIKKYVRISLICYFNVVFNLLKEQQVPKTLFMWRKLVPGIRVTWVSQIFLH